MAEAALGFKRLNHFYGQRLDAEDFRAGDSYFIHKMRLHTRLFHSPGVVMGYDKELEVVAHREGWAVEVKPGYAIDHEGNDIFLRKTEFVEVKVANFPSTAYIVLRYVEEPVDFWVNQANPKYKGHRRILEGAKVEMSLKAPDADGIELARIFFENDEIDGIKDAQDPASPKPGEIDVRYVRRAGTAGSYISPEALVDFLKALGGGRRAFGLLARKYGIQAARDIRSAFLTMEMLLVGNQVTYVEDAFRAMTFVGELQQEFIEEVEESFPDVAGHPRWPEFRTNVEEVRTLLSSMKDLDPDQFLVVLKNQLEANSDLDTMVEAAPAEPVRPARRVEQEAAPAVVESAKAPDAKEVSWQSLQELGTGFPPQKIFMDGQNFALCDSIDMGDPRSEAAHSFAVAEESEQWRANKTYKYPDGARVQATGRAHVHGYSEWVVKNCVPGRDLLMAKRIDFSRGDLVTAILVDGANVGDWEIAGSDRRNPWRNWLFKIPGAAIKGPEVKIRQVATKAERDVNMYGLWFFSAL